jgi:hypothetical protein
MVFNGDLVPFHVLPVANHKSKLDDCLQGGCKFSDFPLTMFILRRESVFLMGQVPILAGFLPFFLRDSTNKTWEFT